MTEEELEVEIVPKNQLSIMVKESDLPEEESTVLINKFSNFFVDVQVWEKKAKAIIVKNESQKAIMDQARQGRLFIRKVRIDIENTRKDLKEASLRKGKAIDKVANFLKDALEPIETHLDKQEHFVEYREAEKEALVRAEIEKKMEEDRLAEEKRNAEILIQTIEENARLRKEAVEREKIKEEEFKASQKKLDEIKKRNNDLLAEEKRKVDEANEKLRLIKQAEMKAEADKQRQAVLLKSADDVVKLQKLHDDLMTIDWPECTTVEGKKARLEAQSHIHVGTVKIEKYLQSKQTTEEEI